MECAIESTPHEETCIYTSVLEGSQWSAPTRRTLKCSEYESDRDWQLQHMRYGEGWACDSTQSHSKRAKPTYTIVQLSLLGTNPDH